MWVTVLVLAVATNFEPARPTLVPLMLLRPRPIAQLVALFCGSWGMGCLAGVLVLFVFHHSPLGSDRANGAKAQIAIGMLTLVVAATMAMKGPRRRRGHGADIPGEPTDPRRQPTPMDEVAERARAILSKGNSPWLAGALGLGIGLPSVDYLAVLVVIATSGHPQVQQLGALLMFLTVGNAFIAIPLITYSVAPDPTKRWIDSFRGWVRARTRREFAAVVAGLGVMQIVLGAIRL